MKKKLLCLVLTLILSFSIAPLGCMNHAYAGDADFKEPGNNFSYDTKSYNKYVARKKVFYVYEQYVLYHLGIGKGDYLGSAELRTYILVPKAKREDGKYHKIIAYELEMHPCTVSSKHSIRSVSRYAYVGTYAEGGDEAVSSRVLAPTAQKVVTTNSKTSTTSTNFSFGLKKNTAKKGATIEASGSVGSEVSRSMTYQSNGLSLTHYKNDGGRAAWAYKYIPREDVEVDAWIASTTYTSGMVDYVSVNNSSMTGGAVSFCVDIRFGAQWFSGSDEGELIYDGSFSWKNYDLGRNYVKSFNMYY